MAELSNLVLECPLVSNLSIKISRVPGGLFKQFVLEVSLVADFANLSLELSGG